MKRLLVSIFSLGFLAACQNFDAKSPIAAQNLLHVSTEQVSFPISDIESVKTIEEWIKNSVSPTSATLDCVAKGKNCSKLKGILHKRNIEFTVNEISDPNQSKIVLVNNKIVKNKCDVAEFGCATSMNYLNNIRY